MGYFGIEPRIANNQRDYFAGNGTTTTFTLSYAPGQPEGILVAVNGVLKKAGYEYTVSGSLITFSSAPPTPTGGALYNVEVIYMFRLSSLQSGGGGGGGGGGGTAGYRQTTSISLPTLASGATSSSVITMVKSAILLSVTSTGAARVRIYPTAATRDSDLTRGVGSIPAAGSPVIETISLTADKIYANVPWHNDNAPADSNCYYNITNNSGSTGIAIGLNLLVLEV